MDNEKALIILKQLLDKSSLSVEEKDAVLTAIGLLSLAEQAKNRFKGQKAKREKSTEW